MGEPSHHPLRPFGPPPPARGRRALRLAICPPLQLVPSRDKLFHMQGCAVLAPSSPSTGEVSPKATEGVSRGLPLASAEGVAR